MPGQAASLQGKSAVVTGASKGLGRGIAAILAEHGCHVTLVARGKEQLQQAEAELQQAGAQVSAFSADVAEEAEVEALFKHVAATTGRCDLLINNAALFDGGPLDQLTLEAWDRVMAVNLRAPFLCTRAALKIMKPQGGGRIINIGSIASQRVRPQSAPYATSKHGLWGLTQVTALEGREYGVTCCCLNPGNILVERRHSDKPEDDEPMMAVEDVAQTVLLMATLPPHVEMLQATVLPHQQMFVGRG